MCFTVYNKLNISVKLYYKDRYEIVARTMLC